MISRLLLLLCHKSLCVSLRPISSLTPLSTFSRGVYRKPSDWKSAAQTHISSVLTPVPFRLAGCLNVWLLPARLPLGLAVHLSPSQLFFGVSVSQSRTVWLLLALVKPLFNISTGRQSKSTFSLSVNQHKHTQKTYILLWLKYTLAHSLTLDGAVPACSRWTQ